MIFYLKVRLDQSELVTSSNYFQVQRSCFCSYTQTSHGFDLFLSSSVPLISYFLMVVLLLATLIQQVRRLMLCIPHRLSKYHVKKSRHRNT